MNSGFFVYRPVLACVLSIVIVLAGLLSILALPIERYPDLVPPQVVITATYPGASAETVAQTVSAPIEQQINGVEGMIYQQSTNTSTGNVSITVTFESGTDPDQATIDVNNRVQQATASLPEEVQRLGVTVAKQNSSIFAVATMTSTDDRFDQTYVSNYALLNVIDELKRVQGIGEAQLFGARNYAMRIWLRPDKVAQFGLTPADIAAAIRDQNAQYAAGSFAAEPNDGEYAFRYSVTTSGRLPDAQAFGDIIVRTDENGNSLRLRDVARVELGAQDYGFSATFNGEPSVPIGLYLQPGANALETYRAVEETMDRLSLSFPDGVTYAIPYETTRFIEASVNEVLLTFAEAMLLVFVVVFLFLQNIRATLIPMLAVPVSIIGTFAALLAFGFSINLLTLFALVLAIGIVVDDAIVVLENVQRIMRDEGLNARDATIKTMGEVTSPVIAIVLVLVAVFVPVAFLGGLAGTMYRQFAITIAVAVTISGIVALTLTPALCAWLLKPEDDSKTSAPFRWFNSAFNKLTNLYGAAVAWLISHTVVTALLFVMVVGSTGYLFQSIPQSLVPDEDQGSNFGVALLPAAASLSRTEAVMDTMSANLMEHPAVNSVVSFSGFDLLAGTTRSNAGVSFIGLKDWSERTTPELDARQLPGAFIGMNSKIRDATVLAFNPPPIQGLSTTGGFDFYLQDRRGQGNDALFEASNAILKAAGNRPELAGVRSAFNPAIPQYEITVRRDKAMTLGVPLATIFDTMQSTFGSLYVNDFTLLGRNYQVSLQSEANFRSKPADLSFVFVRSNSGDMIPLDTLVDVERIIAPDILERFNIFSSAKISGQPAPGYSSGQAIDAMQAVATEALSDDFSIAWTGSAYQEIESSSASIYAVAFGILMVFLILAAQYERWSLPIAVLGAVPFAICGALLAISWRGISNDVYFQIGLVTLVGLAAKNAILIVEFAVLKREDGMSAIDAALAGAKQRFRPIVMTSLAFILGVVPLATATGAGAASRHSIGTGVIGGMLAATFVAILFIPVFYTWLAGAPPQDVSDRQTDEVPMGNDKGHAPAQVTSV